MAEHTPTPWHAGEVCHGYHQIVRNRDNDPVAFCNIAGYTKQTGNANVLRIRACVNAFHSPTRTIPTEQISEGLVWKLIEFLESVERMEGPFRKDPQEFARSIIENNAGKARVLLASLKVEIPE